MNFRPLRARVDLEWGWDPLEATTDVNIADDTFDIVVHPNSSRGTGGVRGDMAFVPGQMYYWEIEVNGSHTATDTVMHCVICVTRHVRLARDGDYMTRFLVLADSRRGH